jgi:drug/metabolite transporter (DMT)-like permease
MQGITSMHAENKTPAFLEITLLLLLGVLWGIPYALTKIALTTIPPITMVAGRVTLASVALWAFVLVKGCKLPTGSVIVERLVIQGLLGCVIPYTLIAFGQQSVGSALTSILNSTAPLFICLISIMSAGQETVTSRLIVGVTIGLGGVVMITGSSALAGFSEVTIGQLAILVATLSSAFGAIHARRFIAIAPEVVAAATLTSAAFLLIPLSFMLESPFHAAPSAAALAATAINGILATALGFLVYFRLIRTLGSVGTTSVAYLRPGIGILVGYLIFGERLTWTMSAGLIVILIGVAAINWRSDRASRSASARVQIVLRRSVAAARSD